MSLLGSLKSSDCDGVFKNDIVCESLFIERNFILSCRCFSVIKLIIIFESAFLVSLFQVKNMQTCCMMRMPRMPTKNIYLLNVIFRFFTDNDTIILAFNSLIEAHLSRKDDQMEIVCLVLDHIHICFRFIMSCDFGKKNKYRRSKVEGKNHCIFA